MANVGDQLFATEAWNLEEGLIDGLLAGGRKSEAVERSKSFIARVENSRGTRSREALDARWHGASVSRDVGDSSHAISELQFLLEAFTRMETYDGGYSVTRLRRELYDMLADQGKAATATEEIQDLLAEKQEELRRPTNWHQILGTKTRI